MHRLTSLAALALVATASCADTREDVRADNEKPSAPEYRAMTRGDVEASHGDGSETARRSPPAIRLTRGLNKLSKDGWRLAAVEPQRLWFDGEKLRVDDDEATYVFIRDE